jgi:hypothetical protein
MIKLLDSSEGIGGGEDFISVDNIVNIEAIGSD